MGETIDKEMGNLETTLTDEVQSDSDKSNRMVCIEIVDGKVHITTLRVSMSRKLRLLLASDVAALCNGFLNGRIKFVAEEDKKAVDEESETETKDAEGEAQNP